jgi:excisionase family DNA binding protein
MVPKKKLGVTPKKPAVKVMAAAGWGNVAVLSAKYGPPQSWWYAQAEAGKIPSYTFGKYRLFRLAEVEAWLEAQRQGPRLEPAER